MATYKRYQKYQKYVNGEPTDEYKQGEYIDTSDYDSLSDCEGGAIYEWRDDKSEYICDGWHSYYKAYRYKSLDGGQTWTKTGSSYQKGSLKEWESAECGWKLLQEWRDTGETKCIGYTLAKEQQFCESRDMGETWNPVEPARFQYVTISSYSENCVLESDPLTYEIESNEVDLNIYVGPYDYYFTYHTVNAYQKADGKVGQYQFWIQWDEDEPVTEYNKTYTDRGFDQSGAYYMSFQGLQSIKVESHKYPSAKKHIIKIWGPVTHIRDCSVPYKIINWGTPNEMTIRDQVSMGYGGHPNTKYETFLNYNYKDIILGSNLLGYEKDQNGGLSSNINFVCHSDNITFLPHSHFSHAGTIDVSNCHNLESIPDIQTSSYNEELYFIRFTAQNCTSLTATPAGITQTGYSQKQLLDCTDAFNGCTSLKRITQNITAQTTVRMFKGCINLELDGTEVIYTMDGTSLFEQCEKVDKYIPIRIDSTKLSKDWSEPIGRENAFLGTNIEEVDLDQIWENVKTGEGTYAHRRYFNNMFKYCKNLKRVTGSPAFTQFNVTIGMFEGCSSLTEVSDVFSNTYTYPLYMDRMFANCDLQELSDNFFRYEGQRYSSAITAYLMFAGNKNLRSFPKHGNIQLWYYPAFYVDGVLRTTYAFLGCPLIEDQIIIQWGGTQGALTDFKPMILELAGGEAQRGYNRTVDHQYLGAPLQTTSDIMVICDDGNFALSSTDYSYSSINGSEERKLYIPNGVRARVYITKEGQGLDMSTYPNSNEIGPTVKVYDFGSHVSLGTYHYYRVSYYGNAEDSAFIKGLTYLTIGPYNLIDENSAPRTVTDDFWKGCSNVRTLGVFKSDVSEDLKLGQYLPEMTQLNRWETTQENFIETFAGCPELLRIDGSINGEGRSLKGMFKDCPKLNYFWSVEGNPTSLEELLMNDVRLNIEAVRFGKSSCSNFIRANYNTGVTSLSQGPLYFPDSSEQYRLMGRDFTECYKNCLELVTARGSSIDLYVDKPGQRTLQLRLNLTRCFEGCVNLKTAELKCYVSGYLDGVNYSSNRSMWLWNAIKEYPELFDVKYEGCFRGCTKISNYDEIPDDWK